MSRRSKPARAAVLASALMVGAAFVLTPWSAGRASEASSTTERKQAEKQQKKKDKEFNRDIEYRRMIGPKVLALGPYSISLFVRGQPLEARLRVAVQMTTEQARVQLEAQKMAVNGIVYPLAVRLFEQGRPTTDQIRAFKDDTREQLLQRYPDMIDEVFIESMI
ncbi:hypothetical protein GCM10017083_25000 [Thalassobaculum fulvum]|uniref:Flagellar protein FliL n=1 Tax=Thalassobaculum fulvum TaxID=1633335 RepID=A0A918XRY4_9PROT|nr:hypothetical protein [Thalassobaculum fulvum]GHD51028.1 hypothetical protein GCM10017083_25000 [Thalassobaculum fulvum]